MARCSFGSVVVNDTFTPQWPFGTDLEARLFYAEEDGRQWLLCAFDFSGTFRRTALRFRQELSRQTGIPTEHIWYHELQIHAAPISWELDGDACGRLIALCVPAVRSMMARAEEAEMRVLLTDLTGYNLNREQYIPGLGAVTVWAGLQLDDEGRPWSQNPAIMNLNGYVPPLPAFDQPIPFDRPTDSQGMLAVFRGKAGQVLGTLTRFAAHPDVAVLFESYGVTDQYRYHFDWTGYLRQHIDGRLGGTSVYLNGPCADLCTKKGYEGMTTYEACDRECRRIGEEIADELLRRWETDDAPWQPVRLGQPAHGSVALPLRASLPHSLEESRHWQPRIDRAAAALQDALRRGDTPATIKGCIDELRHQQTLPTLVNEWVGLSKEELREREAAVEIVSVALNGLLFAGLPGEALTETGEWLRARTLGRRLVPLDQVNGYLGYLTTARAYDEGGYSYWGGWVRRDAEETLRRQALEVIEQAARGL